MSFILLGILNSQVSGAAGGSYELIESNILTSSASSVTFSSIPQDYKHLQIRMLTKSVTTGADRANYIRFNGDSGTNYAYHRLRGDGSSVTSVSSTSRTNGVLPFATSSQTGQENKFAAAVVDVLDYADTNKNTTVRALGGHIATYTYISLFSSLWMNTSSVTSIELNGDGVDLAAGSRFSLYGLR